MPTLAVGPSHGTLVLLTGVEGPAARMAHELRLCITEWSCETELDGAVPVAVELEGELPSLVVVKGNGGLMPLSDKHRARIKDNAMRTLGAQASPTFRFVSTSVEPSATGWLVHGDLSIAGSTQPVEVAVEVGAGTTTFAIMGRASVVQTDFGIRPYTDVFSTIRVRDRVDVELTVIVALARDVVSTEVKDELPDVRERSSC